MDFEYPNKIQYKYMMEGFYKEWVSAGNTGSATYTNLDPGEYVFRVTATNCDGIWSDKAAVVNIEISPPFWKTIDHPVLHMTFLSKIAGETKECLIITKASSVPP